MATRTPKLLTQFLAPNRLVYQGSGVAGSHNAYRLCAFFGTRQEQARSPVKSTLPRVQMEDEWNLDMNYVVAAVKRSTPKHAAVET